MSSPGGLGGPMFRRLGGALPGSRRRMVYCATCPTCDIPREGWYYAEGYGTEGRSYYCPRCGPELEAAEIAEAAAEAAYAHTLPTDADLDMLIDARARDETRAGLLGAGRARGWTRSRWLR